MSNPVSPPYPKVSIGVPVYNGEAYLEEALDAILNQTFQDFEVIICDNASTDRTEEICIAYASRDSRIRYHRNDQNLGAAPNFNLSFQLAKGEYFKWAACDDICKPTFLERCVEILDQNPDAILAYTRATFIKPNGQKWWDAKPIHGLDAEKVEQRFQAAITNFWCLEVFGLIRSDALRKTSLIKSYYGSDKLLLTQLSLLGKLQEVPEKLFLRRCHSNQSSRLSHEDREVWIDAEAAKRSKLLRPRNSLETLKAVIKAPISWPDRMSCSAALLTRALSTKKIKNLFNRRQPSRVS